MQSTSSNSPSPATLRSADTAHASTSVEMQVRKADAGQHGEKVLKKDTETLPDYTLPKPDPSKWTDTVRDLGLPFAKTMDALGAVGGYIGDKMDAHPIAKKIVLIVLAVLLVVGLIAALPWIMKGLSHLGLYKTAKIIIGLGLLLPLLLMGAPVVSGLWMGHKANKRILGS